MRRTLFVFPRDLLPAAWGAPSARVAGQELRKIAKDVAVAGIAADGEEWLAAVRQRLHEVLVRCARRAAGQGGPAGRGRPRPQDRDVARQQVGRRGAHRAARARVAGRVRRHRARPQRRPLADLEAGLDDHGGLAGRAGPAAAGGRGVRRAGPPLAVVVRSRHRGRPRLVARGDQGRRTPRADRRRTPCRSRSTGAAPAGCCPATTRRPRRWSRGPRCCRSSTRRRWAGATATGTSTPRDTPYLFDSNGNGGTTAWWNGRIVGCWVQDDDGPGDRGAARRPVPRRGARRSPPRPSDSRPGSTA